MNGLGSVVFEFLVKPWTQGTGVIKWILNSDTWRKDRPSLSPNWTRLVFSRCINWWLNMDTYSLRGEKLHVFPQTYILTKLMNIMCRFQLIKWNIGPTFWYKAINMVYCKIFNESLSQYLYNLWINCVTAFAFECQYKLGFNLLLNSKYKCILRSIHSHLNMSIFYFMAQFFFQFSKVMIGSMHEVVCEPNVTLHINHSSNNRRPTNLLNTLNNK